MSGDVAGENTVQTTQTVETDNSSRMGHGRIFISHTSLAASRGGNTGERRGQWRCLWEAVAVAQVEKDDGLI